MGCATTPSGVATKQPPTTVLIVCDFDHTLIDVNSDLVLFKDLPYGQPLLPQFGPLYHEHGMPWTAIMQRQLAELAKAEGYCKADVLKCLHDVKMDPFLLSALHALHSSQDPSIKLMIASDANTIFIDEILKANSVKEGTFNRVFTNPATWTEVDAIQVEPYQSVSSPHKCPRGCSANMCKTSILQRARKVLDLEHAEEVQIVYAGDGGNDYCPSLSLSASDLVLVREGLVLQKLIEKAATDESERQTSKTKADAPFVGQVVAQQKVWKTQRELGEILLQLLSHPRVEIETSANDTIEAMRQGIEKGMRL